MKTKTKKTIEKIAKNLVVGDRIRSKTKKILTVTFVLPKDNRIIVLFDGDMEIDFDPYQRLEVLNTIDKK